MRWRSHKKGKYKSQFESKVADYLKQHDRKAEYEPRRFKYTRPAHYTPDWQIGPNRFIEAKGYFSPSDRSKMLAVREEYPKLEFYLLFANSRIKLSRKSKTTYGEWAEEHGFQWADFKSGIPDEWFT